MGTDMLHEEITLKEYSLKAYNGLPRSDKIYEQFFSQHIKNVSQKKDSTVMGDSTIKTSTRNLIILKS